MNIFEARTGSEELSMSFARTLLVLVLVTLGCALPGLAQTLQPTPVPPAGSIGGTVVDLSGAVVAGARVALTRKDQSSNEREEYPSQETVTGNDGQFSFTNLAPGPFQFTITAAGFATQTSSGVLQPGESYVAPQIALSVAEAVTDVEVRLPRAEVAEEQIKVGEKERVLGVIPN